MLLDEIVKKFGNLTIHDKRCDTDDYKEIVIYNRDLEKWNEIFRSIFGSPIKTAGMKPKGEYLLWTKDYGGICRNQILFKKEFGDSVVIAMLWPWQDDIHTTLKLISVKK